ncbi:MAG: bifunctional 5,10-methylenetetrahydrofolate dehydrogenase/5,10-methenyltetrahydrofolate cyclohydrolase [Proteobacteria bacterium]|nr:bifunctional 5,10-methylenetetrahydrofolate dehydrogenase/5,10-methenyltetrahydrofolate cyclohydrolase [Pseudomonadota bacterium]
MILNCKDEAKAILENVKHKALSMKKRFGITPKLAVILVGNNEASLAYVKQKEKRSKEVGIDAVTYHLSDDIKEDELSRIIHQFNDNSSIHGILLQLPLPKHLDERTFIDKIHPKKDVDGFHFQNVGLLNTNQECLIPCTPLGVMHILNKLFAHNLHGKKAAVLGRSRIVGKPMISLLINAGCTVIALNSHSKNPQIDCRDADIIISATGKPQMIDETWVKSGACVIDVGISRINGKLIGDVNFDSVLKVADFVSPVPGGIGQMTVAMLLSNTIKAATQQILT